MKKLVLALVAIAFCSCVSIEAALWGNCCEKSCKKERSEKKDCNRCGACPMKKKCCEKKCERSCKPKCEKSCKIMNWCGKKDCSKNKCGAKNCCKTGCKKNDKKMKNDDMMEESDR